MNRLIYLANKSRVGTAGVGPDTGKEFKGGLTPEENAEFDKLSAISEPLLKSKDVRPVYGIKNPDGTTTLSYTNPTAKEEEAYRQQYGANTSLAQAGVSPYSGGKVLNWEQKQQAMKRVEELRPNYANLSYAQQQEFDAIQRNLYASIAVNKDNPNPPEANAVSIYDNTPAFMKQYGQWGPSAGVQVGAEPGSMPGAGPAKTVVNQTKDANGSVVTEYSDGTTSTTTKDGVTTTTGNTTGNTTQLPTTSAAQEKRQSAYDTLYNEFNKYGLGSMVERVKGLITDASASPSQFSIALQNTPEYQKRFAANQDRIKAGLQALTPAEYIGLEDQYQNIMRNYGLPASYYSKDTLGTQSGFSKLLANDVSAAELEDRIATAQQRVQNSNPEVLQALRQFYPDISNADILSYALDPQNALTNIKRKVTAAEIGGAALAQGLQAQGGTAESLAGYGITKAQAQQGYANVAEMLPRGSQLASIYGQQPYTQQTAEAEVFNTAGAADAAARRKKLTSLEQAQFSGSSGVGALGRDKALYAGMQGQAGLY